MLPDRRAEDRRRLILTGLACAVGAFLLGALFTAGSTVAGLLTGRGPS